MSDHDHDDGPELTPDALAARINLVGRVFRDIRASGEPCEASGNPGCMVCQRHSDMLNAVLWLTTRVGAVLYDEDVWIEASRAAFEVEIILPVGEDLFGMLADAAADFHAFWHQIDDDPELDIAAHLLYATVDTMESDSNSGAHDLVPSVN